MRKRLYALYWWLEKRIHPGLRYSQIHYRNVLDAHIRDGCAWLDLGCGHQLFGTWMKKEEEELAARSPCLVGIDRDLWGLKENQFVDHAVYGDIEALPFESGIFDIVTANMVVEHMENPAVVLQSVERVLRPGGLFIIHTPNRRSVVMTMARMLPQAIKVKLVWILERREEKDVFPTHYAMNDVEAIRRHAGLSGFTVREIRAISTSATTALLPGFNVIELLYLRLLERPGMAGLRSNLIAILEKS